METTPDVVFIQDGIREDDLTNILKEASEGKYSCEFQVNSEFRAFFRNSGSFI